MKPPSGVLMSPSLTTKESPRLTGGSAVQAPIIFFTDILSSNKETSQPRAANPPASASLRELASLGLHYIKMKRAKMQRVNQLSAISFQLSAVA
jgi:hypothetical protein